MQPKRPIRHLSRQTNYLRVLSRSFCRVRFAARKEVEVQDAANYIVLQARPIRRSVGRDSGVDFDVHAIGIEKENGVRARWSVLEVNWVIPVQVSARWNSVLLTIFGLLSIA